MGKTLRHIEAKTFNVQNNTISDELKEEIYHVAMELIDDQSNIHSSYEDMIKILLGLGYKCPYEKKLFADTPQTELMTNEIVQIIYALKKQTSKTIKRLEKLKDIIESEE